MTERTYHCGDELTTVETSVTERTYHCGDVSDSTYHYGDVSDKLSSSPTSSVTERTYHCGDASEELTIVEMSVAAINLASHSA